MFEPSCEQPTNANLDEVAGECVKSFSKFPLWVSVFKLKKIELISQEEKYLPAVSICTFNREKLNYALQRWQIK